MYEMVLAARFGTGREADALAFALLLVMAGANEIGTWIGTVFIPAYIDIRTRDGEDRATGVFRLCLVAVVAGGAVLAALLAITAPAVVRVVAPALADDGHGVLLLRLFVPLLVLVPVTTLIAGALQAHDRFAVAGSRTLWWYGGTLLSLIALAGVVGAAAVPLGMVAGFTAFAVVLGIRAAATLPAPAGGAPGAAAIVRALGVSMLPLVLVSAVNYLNVSFERALASRLPPGSLSSLTYAFRLLNFPVNLLVLNATTMLLPALSRRAARQDAPAVSGLLDRAVRLTVLFTVPLAALGMALAEPGVRVLLERGAFGMRSTALTATAIVWYAPGIVAMAAAQVLGRGYQARRDIRRLALPGVAAMLFSIAVMPLATFVMEFRGLPLASSLTAWLLFALMLAGLRGSLPDFAASSVLASCARAAAAGIVAGVAAVGGRAFAGDSALGQVIVGGALGLLAYAVALRALSRADLALALDALAPGLARRPSTRPV